MTRAQERIRGRMPIFSKGLRMLVLTRKQDERILILVSGKEIEIKVTEIRSHQAKSVRIGIEAPDDVLILRPELLKQAAIA